MIWFLIGALIVAYQLEDVVAVRIVVAIMAGTIAVNFYKWIRNKYD